MIADRLMREYQLPLSMSRAPYPCWGLKLNEPISNAIEFVGIMTESRKDECWLLLGGHAAVSENQLWTAWLGLKSRSQNDSMRANSADAEFIRLIAGTHQIRVGFERAGIADGEQMAWLIYLPDFPTESIQEMSWPSLDRHVLDQEAQRLMTVLGATLLPHLPMPNTKTVERLELNIEPGSVEDYHAIERSALAHIALADYS